MAIGQIALIVSSFAIEFLRFYQQNQQLHGMTPEQVMAEWEASRNATRQAIENWQAADRTPD